jgi:hypothetical protein
MDGTTAVLLRLHLKLAVGAVAIVIPAGMVEERIEANSLDRNATPERLAQLSADGAQPGRAQVTLDAGPGQKDQAVVARVDGREQ